MLLGNSHTRTGLESSLGVTANQIKGTKLKLWCFCSEEFGFNPDRGTCVLEQYTLL